MENLKLFVINEMPNRVIKKIWRYVVNENYHSLEPFYFASELKMVTEEFDNGAE